jgi:hypothetical protein
VLKFNDIDEAADTLRFVPSPDPDATSIYDLGSFDDAAVTVRYVGTSKRVRHRRRLIRDTRENIVRLREVIAEGWNIAAELAHEERRLAQLEAAARRDA